MYAQVHPLSSLAALLAVLDHFSAFNPSGLRACSFDLATSPMLQTNVALGRRGTAHCPLVMSAMDELSDDECLNALERSKSVYELERSLSGPDHPATMLAMNKYAVELLKLGHKDEAEPLIAKALDLSRQILGPEHPDTLTALSDYADALAAQVNADEDGPLLMQVLEFKSEFTTNLLDRSDRLKFLSMAAIVYVLLDHQEEAVPVLKEAHELSHLEAGPDDPSTILLVSMCAFTLSRLDREAEAAPFKKDLVEFTRKMCGPHDPGWLAVFGDYIQTLVKLNRTFEAEPLMAERFEVSRRLLGPEHPDTLRALSSYAFTLNALGYKKEAEPLMKEVIDLSRRSLGPKHPWTLEASNNYADAFTSCSLALGNNVVELRKFGSDAELKERIRELKRRLGLQ